jgi:nucleotide-binding universal stress UspA family protein
VADPDQHPVVICYDGSDNAKHAIARAAALVRSGPAIVLHVWQPLAVIITRGGFGALAGRAMLPDDESEERREAEAMAAEGRELARDAGFDVEARHLRTVGSTPQAIIDAAHELGASMLVMGSRGLGGLRSALLGSVSHELVMRSHMPVLVVPPEHDHHD